MAALKPVTHFKGLNGKVRVELEDLDGLHSIRPQLHAEGVEVARIARSLLRSRTVLGTGDLVNSIRVTRTFSRGDEIVVQIGTDNPHGEWVEQGTGVFGPRAQRIKPRSKPYMVFWIEGARRRNFSRGRVTTKTPTKSYPIKAFSTRGQVGKHYLRDALRFWKGFGPSGPGGITP